MQDATQSPAGGADPVESAPQAVNMVSPEATRSVRVRIDFVSDVACPWCAVGLKSLEQALDRLGDQVTVDLHFQPFELNPQMPPEGEDATEHLVRKYGSTPEQLERNREAIRARGAELGFVFNRRHRVYNTFDAHRLLHWAGLEGRALALKHALLRAYFTNGEDVSSHTVLEQLAAEAGLDVQGAQRILSSDAYAADVRSQERRYTAQGIRSVPSVIIDRHHLIQGGQPVDVFERALREVTGVDVVPRVTS